METAKGIFVSKAKIKNIKKFNQAIFTITVSFVIPCIYLIKIQHIDNGFPNLQVFLHSQK